MEDGPGGYANGALDGEEGVAVDATTVASELGLGVRGVRRERERGREHSTLRV